MFANLDYSAAEDVTKSAVLLNEDDPGEAGKMNMFLFYLNNSLTILTNEPVKKADKIHIL